MISFSHVIPETMRFCFIADVRRGFLIILVLSPSHCLITVLTVDTKNRFLLASCVILKIGSHSEVFPIAAVFTTLDLSFLGRPLRHSLPSKPVVPNSGPVGPLGFQEGLAGGPRVMIIFLSISFSK